MDSSEKYKWSTDIDNKMLSPWTSVEFDVHSFELLHYFSKIGLEMDSV